jgi:hypothetical protein
MFPDYYAILHVDPGAPTEVIRASYRTLMQRLRAHPDLGGDHEAAARLNAAYATLKNPRSRAAYDAQRAQAGGATETPGPDRPAARPGEEPARRAVSSSGRYGSNGTWTDATTTGARVGVCIFCGTAATGSHGGDSSSRCRGCGAPLTAVRELGGDSSEQQRSIYRIAKAAELRVYSAPEDRSGIDALVHDISLSGMRFSCAYPFEAGDLIRAECEICAAVARIAHVARAATGAHEYGAEFLTVRFNRQRGSLLSVPA